MATSPTRLNPYKLGIELFRHIEDRWNRGAFGQEYDDCDDLVEKRRWNTQAGLGREKIFEVRKIHNELTVAGPTSMVARSNDAWLTTKVKARLIAKESKGTKIKVLTENSIVYMQGLVTRDQADEAVNVAKDIYGIQKIVKVFEYLD